MAAYAPLPLRALQVGASYYRPQQDLPERVEMDSAAVDVMTDLARVTAITIEPQVPVQAAHKKMIRDGVRLLLVIDAGHAVVGLVTATDILGEKPMKFVQQHGGHHGDVLVEHIMTPHERLEVLLLTEVARARVGDIVATLRRAGRQHALVVDEGRSGQSIRGIFSTTQISRQLGMPIDTVDVAKTFAEVEMALHD